MGGDYYERPMEVNDPVPKGNNQAQSNSQAPSQSASKAMSQNSLHKSNDPKRWVEEKMISTHRHPIVFALDVSGSMSEWPKIIYDKLPMFYGQIMMQSYISDPSVSFCAIDDTHDRAPLQTTEFGQGVQIDQLISKIYLESGGSGEQDRHEVYELSAYFYLNRVELIDAELPYFFVTGDEDFYKKIKPDTIEKIIGGKGKDSLIEKIFGGKEIDSFTVWKELCKKYNVFHLHKPYDNVLKKKELNQWKEAIGIHRILEMKTPKACVDVILGVIALTSGARTLETYVKDMIDRGQSEERIEEVKHALRNFDLKQVIRNKVFEKSKEEKEKEKVKLPEEEKKE